MDPPSVDAARFYAEYHGHPLDQLDALHAALAPGADVTVFLTGDSSLDNKHWFFSESSPKEEQLTQGAEAQGSDLPNFLAPAVNGYETLLKPSRMVKDVAYFVNFLAPSIMGARTVCFNAAVEESTIRDRMEAGSGLLPHDEWVRGRLGRGGTHDVVVLSVGGNDVALRPTLATSASLFALTRLPMPLLRFFGRWAPGFGHMQRLFHGEVEAMVKPLQPQP